MKATLMLCDFAQVAEGKLYITGGGWSVIVGRMRGHIAARLQVSWDQANRRVALSFSLLDEDGGPVPFDSDGNRIELAFEVGRPPGLPRGTDLDVPLAIELPILELNPGSYSWLLEIDGRTEENWRLPFVVLPPPRMPVR